MKNLIPAFALVVAMSLNSPVAANDQQPQNTFIPLPDGIIAAEDVSAVEAFGSFLIIGADEAVKSTDNDEKDIYENKIQLLQPDKKGNYLLAKSFLLFNWDGKKGAEMDIEAIAADMKKNHVYVAGSHSKKRKTLKDDKSLKKNRKSLTIDGIKTEKNRDWLYRLTLTPEGNETAQPEKISLRALIDNDTTLESFTALPSKENGVDIEGLAFRDGFLYIGFRGPVLREGHVPVLKLSFDAPEEYKLLFVKLGGYGIRGMVTVSDGFILLTGPVGAAPGPYQLHHWNGREFLSDNEKINVDGKVRLLGKVTPPPEGKAEGIALLDENDSGYSLILVYDGVKDTNKVMQRHFVPKGTGN